MVELAAVMVGTVAGGRDVDALRPPVRRPGSVPDGGAGAGLPFCETAK
jgi:hypothetical protein